MKGNFGLVVMTNKPYKKFMGQELSLRDRLAVERTSLANERTLLSYVRTMIGIIAVGATVIKFFQSWYFISIGIILIFFGFTTLLVGLVRFARTYLVIAELENSDEELFKDDPLKNFLWHSAQKLHLIH